jgi:hypothetical protein
MSCLFHSLSRFVEEDSSSLRKKICDYLATNPMLFGDVTASSAMEWDGVRGDYVHHMRSTSTWGGAIEIKAFCNLYGMKVVVENIRDRNGDTIEFVPESGAENSREIRITWSGGHYEPLVPARVAAGPPPTLPQPEVQTEPHTQPTERTCAPINHQHRCRFRIRFR